MRANLLLIAICAHAIACEVATPVTIGTKTSLERQLMGEFEPLTEEEILASSIRARNDVGAGSVSDLQLRAMTARRRQLFNLDDIEELKQLGCLGEASDARLASRPCKASPEQATLLPRLIEQENSDRDVIIDWAVAADPVLTPADRPEVVDLYNEMVRRKAKPGEWLEDNGSWRKIPPQANP